MKLKEKEGCVERISFNLNIVDRGFTCRGHRPSAEVNYYCTAIEYILFISDQGGESEQINTLLSAAQLDGCTFISTGGCF